MDNEQLWQAILGELEINLSSGNFNTWLKNTFIIPQENNSIIVGVPNTFTKTWLENKYQKEIVEALKRISANKLNNVFYQVKLKSQHKPIIYNNISNNISQIDNKIIDKDSFKESCDKHGLNPRYTFKNFIVGKNNELAVAAAKAVVNQPGKAYNPLFIYGNAGLGKTHLIQAIGHALAEKKQVIKIVYITSEKFTNEFIYSLKNNKINQFQQKYRLVDVLIVDDIQFLVGKNETQEQFFHTFNELHQNDKQIILSSDRPPKAIHIEQRLQTRFEWGMTADISEPDFETRVAILQGKLAEKSFILTDDIVIFLAENIQTNVRELEGALNRIYANFQLKQTIPNLEEVKNILKSINTITPRSSINPKRIINIVAEFYNISLDEITGSSRKKELVVPRQIATYLMRDEINTSFPNIGQELGGRDHTTAMHGYEKIKKELETNEKIRADIAMLHQKLCS